MCVKAYNGNMNDTTESSSYMSRRQSWILLTSLFVLVAAFVFVGVATFFQEGSPSYLEVSFLDVGQGDAIFIESPSGIQVLVDAGRSKGTLEALSEVMPWFDRSIDMAIVTHADADHIGGLPDLLERYRVGWLGLGQPHQVGAAYQAVEELRASQLIPAEALTTGEVIDLGEGVYLEVLFPPMETLDFSENDASVVMRLVYGDTSVLLTGDTTKAVERYLVQTASGSLASTVLKVAHHGSDTSSDAQFLRAVSPQLAVIQAGRDNPYGHPHPVVLERLNGVGSTTVLCTCEVGTVMLVSDGTRIWRER